MTQYTTLIILVSILILLILGFVIYSIFWKKNDKNVNKNNAMDEKNNSEEKIAEQLQKLRDEVIETKTKTDSTNTGIGSLHDTVKNLSSEQIQKEKSFNNLIEKINDFKKETEKYQNTSQLQNQSLGEWMNELKNIFSSNYQRGNLGETTLYLIVENIFGADSQIVRRQHIMKNKKKPDLFLQSEQIGIPIDSKFPLDNFVKITKLNEKNHTYKEEVKLLKQHLSSYVKDIADKYISSADNTEIAVMYLPSQALFDFIYKNKEFYSLINTEAVKKKVTITSPNTLPALLRIILAYSQETRMRRQAGQILQKIKAMKTEFWRFTERWQKIDQKVEGLVNDVRKFNITTKKLQNKFISISKGNENIDSLKTIEDTKNKSINSTKINEKKQSNKTR